jgi:hypothetical protein
MAFKQWIFFLLFVPTFLFSSSPKIFGINESMVSWIGERIYQNECGKKEECLLSWNVGEDFLSLGIGHFIWLPLSSPRIFEEQFPSFIVFLKERNVSLPSWINECPWKTREDFLNNKNSSQYAELLDLLKKTISLQTAFIIDKFESSLNKILLEYPSLIVNVQAIGHNSAGMYALIDYANFKGTGLNPNERYQGQGWGLIQVLEQMDKEYSDPLVAFRLSAEKILKKRIALSPKERREDRWLKGWLNRLSTYTL